MKKLGIATDSHSGITPQRAQELGVHVLPMPFTINGREYFEGETLTREEFFVHQRAKTAISTAQSAPAAVTSFWDELLENYETLLYIPISSGLSGSCQTAQALAAEKPYLGRVFVVDNGRVATPMHRSVLDAIELMQQGYDAPAIREALEKYRGEMVIYVALQTMEHLRRGGRISTTTAVVGSLLNIKPIMHFTTGKLSSYKNARGMNKACEIMLQAIRSDLASRFQEAHARGDIFLLAASSADAETTRNWIKQIERAFPDMPVLCDDLALGVSCHIGEGGLGVGLSVRPRI